MALPYSSHPLYTFRKASIITALIGILLCQLSNGPYVNDSLVASCFWLFASAVFCAADVLFYASKNAEKNAEMSTSEPEWPTLMWMIGDGILAVILQMTFWGTMDSMNYAYRDPGPVGTYGALADMVCSILHAYCLWKQIQARYKKKWLLELGAVPCPSCGYGRTYGGSAASARSDRGPDTVSSVFVRGPTLTPEGTESTMEEGLLIGSEYSGYGSISDPEPTIQPSDEVIVGRPRKSRKAEGLSKKAGKLPQ